MLCFVDVSEPPQFGLPGAMSRYAAMQRSCSPMLSVSVL